MPTHYASICRDLDVTDKVCKVDRNTQQGFFWKVTRTAVCPPPHHSTLPPHPTPHRERPQGASSGVVLVVAACWGVTCAAMRAMHVMRAIVLCVSCVSCVSRVSREVGCRRLLAPFAHAAGDSGTLPACPQGNQLQDLGKAGYEVIVTNKSGTQFTNAELKRLNRDYSSLVKAYQGRSLPPPPPPA